MLRCLPILILFLFFQAGHTQSQYHFQHFGTQEGLASDGNYAVVQDSLGFLWVHHPFGLSRFDGYNFKVYKYDPADSLSSPGSVFDGRIFLDRSGHVWTKNHQVNEPDFSLTLTRYDNKADRFVHYHPDMQGAFAFQFCFDKNNPVLWIGTSFPGQGLFRFNTETLETKRLLNAPGPLPDLTRGSPIEQRNAIFAISDQGSFLLLATWAGLWKFDKKTEAFSRPDRKSVV